MVKDESDRAGVVVVWRLSVSTVDCPAVAKRTIATAAKMAKKQQQGTEDYLKRVYFASLLDKCCDTYCSRVKIFFSFLKTQH